MSRMSHEYSCVCRIRSVAAYLRSVYRLQLHSLPVSKVTPSSLSVSLFTGYFSQFTRTEMIRGNWCNVFWPLVNLCHVYCMLMMESWKSGVFLFLFFYLLLIQH